jgi:hypothetical protein
VTDRNEPFSEEFPLTDLARGYHFRGPRAETDRIILDERDMAIVRD